MIQHLLRALLVTILSLVLFACGKHDEPGLAILSSPLNKNLEPLVTEIGRRIGVDVEMTYQQSPAIAQEIQKGKAGRFDAVWPGSSLWIVLGDTQGVARHSQSIQRSPVVLAVKKPLAELFGWIGETTAVGDILEAADRGELHLALTSPTRSTLGASAYLGYLHAAAGAPEVLTRAHLQDPKVVKKVRGFWRNVDRHAGGARSLMEQLVTHYDQFDSVVNHEVRMIDANRKLTAQGRPPLYAFYPVEELTMTDSPLAYIDRGDAGKEQAFLELQQALLEDESQQKVLQHARRPGREDVDLDAADRSLFNPQWGIDLERPLSPMTWPSRDVIREALQILVTQAPGPIADAPSPIRLATIVSAASTAISVVILRKAYARLGYAVEISRYPAEVALRLVDAGREDGEVQRIDGLSKEYPNLVQLHPAINYIEAAVFTAGRDIPLDGWSSLQPYRVGVMRGIKFAEFNTRGMDRVVVGDYSALFQMLGEGRFDVAVSPRMMGILELKRLGITGISPVEPPLERFPVYHYIHRSRAELAPKLEAEFKIMQETGELTAIRQRVIAELMRRAEKGLPICEDDNCSEPPVDGGARPE